MSKITIQLTEDQARWIVYIMEQSKDKAWDSTQEAFTRRIKAKLAKAKS